MVNSLSIRKRSNGRMRRFAVSSFAASTSSAITFPCSPTSCAAGTVKKPVPQPTSRTTSPAWSLAPSSVLCGSKTSFRRLLAMSQPAGFSRRFRMGDLPRRSVSIERRRALRRWSGRCLTSALCRAVEGAERRHASVGHQRAVRWHRNRGPSYARGEIGRPRWRRLQRSA